MPRVLLGHWSSLADGETRIVPHPEGKPPFRSIILVRREDALRAYWNVCQHLPVPLDSGVGALPPDDALVCLTHGARYDALSGRCTAGPCPGASLMRLAIERDGDEIWARLED